MMSQPFFYRRESIRKQIDFLCARRSKGYSGNDFKLAPGILLPSHSRSCLLERQSAKSMILSPLSVIITNLLHGVASDGGKRVIADSQVIRINSMRRGSSNHQQICGEAVVDFRNMHPVQDVQVTVPAYLSLLTPMLMHMNCCDVLTTL